MFTTPFQKYLPWFATITKVTGMHIFPLGVQKLTTSAYSSSGNGGVKRAYNTMVKIQAMVCNEHQRDWDAHLFHAEYAYNNSASVAAGLTSNEKVNIRRLPCPFLAVIDRPYDRAHQSFDCDHLAYCDLALERQQHAYELAHDQHTHTVARVNGRNSTLSDALLRDIFILGNWTNPPSALHPTVSTTACQRSRARDRLHQR